MKKQTLNDCQNTLSLKSKLYEAGKDWCASSTIHGKFERPTWMHVIDKIGENVWLITLFKEFPA